MTDLNHPQGDSSHSGEPIMPDAPQAPAPQQQLSPQNLGAIPQQPVQQQPVQQPIPEPEVAEPAKQTIQNAQPVRDGNEPKLDVGAMTGKVKDFTSSVTSKMGKDAKFDRIMMIVLYVCGGILAIGPFLTNIIVEFGGAKEVFNFVLPKGAGIGDGVFLVITGVLLAVFVYTKLRMGQVISSGVALLIWLWSNFNINSKLGELGSLFGVSVSKNIMYPILFLAALAGFVISLVYLLKDKKVLK